MENVLGNTYDPDIVEEKTIPLDIYKANEEANKYRIILPPPNVTGKLHIGHALTCFIQDTVVRYKRMKGENPEWIPGTDHAGIATQIVVEKMLLKEGINPKELSREELLKKICEWKNEHGNIITDQLKQLGCSFDWAKEQFTMNEQLSKAVTQAFCKLYNKCLIYRDIRIINWCPYLKTALSEIEINNVTIDRPTNYVLPGYNKKVSLGWIYELKYEVYEEHDTKITSARTESYISIMKKNINKQKKRYITVATTRPETLFGDVAIAVCPNDLRYIEFHEKYVINPFNKKLLPIILDNEFVNMEKGTGAVKITPGHDKNDFMFGKKYNLPTINIFNKDGTLNKECNQFEGMNRYDARFKVLDELNKKGLYVGKKPNPMTLSFCSRSGDVIEPMILPQWYIDCKEMAKKAIEAVEKGDIDIMPEYNKKIWNHWLENIQPWCISRQLVWGHRIPAYNIKSSTLGIDDWIVASNIEEVNMIIEREYSSVEDLVIEQDEDVLDTWFSSAIYPFTIYGWTTQKDISNKISEEELNLKDKLNTANKDEYVMYETNKIPLSRNNGLSESMLEEFELTDSILEEQNAYETSIESSEKYQNIPVIDLMETGKDILFFWVARTTMLSLELVRQIPFKKVYLHNMVRDKNGHKMSKSKGNVIDPLDIIHGCSFNDLLDKLNKSNLSGHELKEAETYIKKNFPDGIPKFGTDALRMTLLSYVGQDTDIYLDLNEIKRHKFFCNKLWNAFKFSFHHLDKNFEKNYVVDFDNLDIHHKWIINTTIELGASISNCIENMDFSKGIQLIHSFWYDNFCGIYLELIKYDMRDEMINEININEEDRIEYDKKKKTTKVILFNILITSLKIIHPFVPFLSQFMYERMRGLDCILCLRPWPKFNLELIKEKNEMDDMDIVKEYIHRIHNKKKIDELSNKSGVENLKNNLNFMFK